MNKIIVIGICISCLFMIGCQKEQVEPYALTTQVKENLTEEEQAFFVAFTQSCIETMGVIRDENSTYEEGLQALQATYKMVPNNWAWNKIESISDKSISFFLQMMDCYMGCRNYDNYADCKDATELLAEEMASQFVNKEEIREGLTFSETRFKKIYDRGKKAQ